MRKALLDTDALSEIIKGKNEGIRLRAEAYLVAHERLTITSISVMEVAKGLHKIGKHADLQRFTASLDALEVLTFDRDAAVIAGRIYADLERAGQPIGRADPMVAALALVNGLVLVTGNVEHYERIAQLGHPLEIENWIRP
jgi:tRNA(fMet)-specific endonuclease VapC